MDLEHLAVGPIEPGEDHETVAGHDPFQGVENLRLEVDPCIRRALVALPWRGVEILQRRFNAADDSKVGRG